MNVEESLIELRRFSEEVLTIGDPCTDEQIDQFEKRFGVHLPNDLKSVLLIANGFELIGTTFLGFGDEDYGDNLNSVYKFEHTEVLRPQPIHIIPFSPDGRGNYYCVDIKDEGGKDYDVVFWVRNYPYNESDQPEITHKNLADFIKDVVIDWTLEDYNYDGTEK